MALHENEDMSWALHTPSIWESPDERSIPHLLAAIGQVLERMAPPADYVPAAKES